MSVASNFFSDWVANLISGGSYNVSNARSISSDAVSDSIESMSTPTGPLGEAAQFVKENIENGAEFINGDNNLIKNISEWFLGANPQTTRDWNAEQAKIERNWQTDMSNTAYQRAVSDMTKAGINPILAYSQGGASSGTGAAASSSPNSAGSIAPIIDSIGKLCTGLMEHDRKSDKDASDAALAALKFTDKHSATQAYNDSSKAAARLANAKASLAEDDYYARQVSRLKRKKT